MNRLSAGTMHLAKRIFKEIADNVLACDVENKKRERAFTLFLAFFLILKLNVANTMAGKQAR